MGRRRSRTARSSKMHLSANRISRTLAMKDACSSYDLNAVKMEGQPVADVFRPTPWRHASHAS